MITKMPSPAVLARIWTTLEGRWAVLLVLGLVFVVIHEFWHYAVTAPYAAMDDGLANIAHSIVTQGRYGFLSSPLQGTTLELRTDAFFNQGPAYYFAGAALEWLFGPGIFVQRLLHPLAVLAVILLLWPMFRTARWLWVVTAAALLWIFNVAHWPMVRPDSFVSLFAAMAVVSGVYALTRNARAGWYGLGFGTAAAFITHQIAWPLVVAAVLIWGLGAWLWRHGVLVADRGFSTPAWNGLWGIAGGMTAALGFLWAIDFQLGALIQLWRAYATAAAAHGDVSTLHVLATHWEMGSAYFGTATVFIVLGLDGLALLLVVVGALRLGRMPDAARWIGVLAPGLLLTLAYAAGLSRYPNYHLGYVILIQFGAVWVAASALLVLWEAVVLRMPSPGWVLNATGMVLASVFVGVAGRDVLANSNGFEQSAALWTPYGEYEMQLLSVVPAGGSVWGSPMWGVQSGGRINLVSVNNAVSLAQGFSPEGRSRIAPDYVLFSYPERRDFTRLALAPETDQEYLAVRRFSWDFPGYRYQLTRIVDAPPYGPSFLYRRLPADAAPGEEPPTVLVRRTGEANWSSGLGAPIAVDVSVSEPVGLRISYGRDVLDAELSEIVQMELDAGRYLVELRFGIPAADREEVGVAVATSGDAIDTVGSEMGLGIVSGLVLPGDDRTYLVVDHTGGALRVAMIGAQRGLRVAGVRPILWAAPTPLNPLTGGVRLPLPVPREWNEYVTTDGGHVTPTSDGGVVVLGSQSPWGYQLVTPPLNVPTDSDLVLSLPLNVESGRVAVGVLDAQGQWLLPPGATDAPLSIRTGRNHQISIVVANDLRPGADSRSRFTMAPGGLYFVGPSVSVYVDLLTTCIREPRSPVCLP